MICIHASADGGGVGRRREMGEQRLAGGYRRVKRFETGGKCRVCYLQSSWEARSGRVCWWVCSALIPLRAQGRCLLKNQRWKGRSACAPPELLLPLSCTFSPIYSNFSGEEKGEKIVPLCFALVKSLLELAAEARVHFGLHIQTHNHIITCPLHLAAPPASEKGAKICPRQRCRDWS